MVLDTSRQVVWMAGTRGAVHIVAGALRAVDPTVAHRVREVTADVPAGTAVESLIVCLDLPVEAVRGMRGIAGAHVTSPAALASDREALSALLDRAGVDARHAAAVREHVVEALAAGRNGSFGEDDPRLAEALDLLERQAELHAETVALAREMTALAATPSWLVARLARAPRMRWRTAMARLRGRARGVRAPRRPRLEGRPFGVNVAGYIAAESGMGEAARASIRALVAAGVPVALNNVDGPARTADPSFTSFDAGNPHAVNLVHLNADNMEAFACERGRAYFRDRYTVGYWFWELGRFRDDWLAAFDFVHEVWVASGFVRDALEPISTVPVTCLPPCVTLPDAADTGREHFGLPPEPFVFLYTFDVSSQTERKNPLGLLRAFRRARLGHHALLVLKFTNGDTDPAAVRELQHAAEGLPVRLLDGYMARADLAALLRAADGYVSLHRSEGFGLAMAEAMLLDKPVVATGYSGNLEFMTADTAWLVDHRLVPLARDHGPYLRGFEWAEPDEDHAAALMRAVVLDRDETARRARRGGDRVRRLLGVDASAARVRTRLEAIMGESGTPATPGTAR